MKVKKLDDFMKKEKINEQRKENSGNEFNEKFDLNLTEEYIIALNKEIEHRIMLKYAERIKGYNEQSKVKKCFGEKR